MEFISISKLLTESTTARKSCLSAQVDHVGVSVVEGEHDAVGSIQLDHDDRIVEMIRRPQRVLTFRHFRESGGEDQSVAQVNGPCGFGTFVANGFFIHGTRARIDDADLFVFAGGEQFSSVPAPASGIHQIRMGVDHYGRLASSNVPDYHQVVRACGGFRKISHNSTILIKFSTYQLS